MRFYPMYLTEYEIELILAMLEDLNTLKQLTAEQQRMIEVFTITLNGIRERKVDGN